MNDEQNTGYGDANDAPLPGGQDAAWQRPQQPQPQPQAQSQQPPQPTNPAAEFARQQLAQAYGQAQPPASTPAPPQTPTHSTPPGSYNPYRHPEQSYSVPASQQQTQQQPAWPGQPVEQQQQQPPQPNQPVAANNSHQQPAYNPALQHQAIHGSVEHEPQRSVADIKKQLLTSVRSGSSKKLTSRWKPAITAILVGAVFMLVSYNEVAIAQIRQYVSPGSSLTTPVIVDPTAEVNIGNDPRIIIPKINVDVPVVYDEKTYDENRIQAALERGVVHYGETALPGQVGNNVIVGHSSNNFFNSGKYKFAFVLLDRLEEDDTFILHYKGTRYIYKVFNKQVISPDDFSLIQSTNRPVTTLITCTPPGTAWRRLVIQAEQISPSIEDAKKADTQLPDDIGTSVPGSAPSFWDRLSDIF